jgi:hypothetical protein
LWIAAGACFGVLAYCALNGLWAGALVSAGALAISAAAALLFHANAGPACPVVRPLGGPYGNGPYRKAECQPNGKVVTTLADIATRLRELPEREPGEWTVDWQPFDVERAAAAAAAQAGDYMSAVRKYSHAIREIMRELREHRPTVDRNETATFDPKDQPDVTDDKDDPGTAGDEDGRVI